MKTWSQSKQRSFLTKNSISRSLDSLSSTAYIARGTLSIRRRWTTTFRTKVHKRRMKALEDEPYSIAESERAGATGTSVIILPAIQGSAASVVDDAADTGPSQTVDLSKLPAAPAPTDSGRGSRLSVITVSAPVQCVCAFVAARARRHCAECRRRRCDFAASKTVGYCGLPTLVVAWGAFWVLIILALGGVLNVSAPTGG
ncbi:Zinc finger protein 593 [Amphibalanus amphitrite]|uniref:Zinc finger protein 593 n=1 Tax=Amphibalanus amphitrite TaxID=1232801 RepID=A0A6A4VPZ2_AMPAM|nr:Zinc finger protein 593 [Amphibalanus amphitrite]